MSLPSADESLPFLPFALPEIGEEEIEEVIDTLRSGWITTGPKAKRFESEFAAWLAGHANEDPHGLHCVAVNSATAGLHLALEALCIGPGDEVIVPTHTFTATAEVVRYVGADVRLVDVDPVTLNIDPAAMEAAITPRTRAVLPVHYGGLSADMSQIGSMARRYGLKVVEDAAHALPATAGGRLIGTLDTHATVFSFYANKTITTGEGGMLVTRHDALAARARIMRLHGMSRDAFDRFTANVPSWYYEIVAPGFKYNLTDLAAAIGLQQLKKAWDFQSKRLVLAEHYDQCLADLPLVLPAHAPAGDLHSWHLYPVRLRDDVTLRRDDLMDRLCAAGIGASVHYIPLHLQPYWRDRYHLTPDAFPNSQHAFERLISLPIFTRMNLSDVERVAGVLRRLLLA